MKAVAAAPEDHAARLALSESLAAAGNHEASLQHLLHLMKAAPAWNEGAAKKTLLRLLDSLGPAHPLAVRGRKELSKLLFR